jgi:hypothetical protein
VESIVDILVVHRVAAVCVRKRPFLCCVVVVVVGKVDREIIFPHDVVGVVGLLVAWDYETFVLEVKLVVEL